MKRLADMLKQIPLIAGFLAIIGLSSYLVMMILRSAVRALGFDFVSTEKKIVIGMIISAVLCFVMCYFGLRKYLEKLGRFDAKYVRDMGGENKPQMWYAFLTCGFSLAAFGAVLVLFNFYHWNFFEGPAFYLSFAFYSIPETLYADTTTSFVFWWCEVISYLICFVLYIPAMLRGYANGFKKEMK